MRMINKMIFAWEIKRKRRMIGIMS
jgi:hypothetical protein